MAGGSERYVLLLRGINVGGHNKLPMKELKTALVSLGFRHVNHYIQSGNLVFATEPTDTAALEEMIEANIVGAFSISVPAMVLSADEFERAVQRFPFSDEQAEASVLTFLSGDGSAEWADRARSRTDEGDEYERIESVAYMYCPNGLSRSKAAATLHEKPKQGIKATNRNWRTVNKIVEMLDAIPVPTESAN